MSTGIEPGVRYWHRAAGGDRVYKFGIENSPLTKQQIADEIGVTLGGVSWRVGNFKAIDGLGKATNVASLSREVYKKYSSLTETELEKLAFNP